MVLAAIRVANERILARADEDLSLRGMGTTIALLLLRPPRAHVAHVGDSRIYRLGAGGLEQLTRDHCWPGSDGRPSNVLTRALGAEEEIEIDYQVLRIAPGDVYLLCSDGLTRAVDDAAISAAIREAPDGTAAGERLIELTHAAGAPDNVTVVLAYC